MFVISIIAVCIVLGSTVRGAAVTAAAFSAA